MTDYRGDRHKLRKPCTGCGGTAGRITTRNSQDCVYCVCGRYQYNAPKVETGRKVRTVSTVHDAIKPKLRAKILMRANGRCEMCGRRENLHVGHLLSVEAGLRFDLTEDQLNHPENLAAMCDACNLGIGKEPVPARFLIALVLARIGAGEGDQ